MNLIRQYCIEIVGKDCCNWENVIFISVHSNRFSWNVLNNWIFTTTTSTGGLTNCEFRACWIPCWFKQGFSSLQAGSSTLLILPPVWTALCSSGDAAEDPICSPHCSQPPLHRTLSMRLAGAADSSGEDSVIQHVLAKTVTLNRYKYYVLPITTIFAHYLCTIPHNEIHFQMRGRWKLHFYLFNLFI